MRRDRTDVRPITVQVTRSVMLAFVATLVLLPLLGFFLAVKVLGPHWYGKRLSSLEKELAYMHEIKTPETDDMERLKDQLAILQEDLRTERQMRAEAEAKVTMAETARAEASGQSQEVEAELSSLRRTVAVYEELMKPRIDNELYQCFNISASYRSGKVNYQVSFLKKNPKDNNSLETRVEVRILHGDNIFAINRAQAYRQQPDNLHTVAFNKDYRLSGDIDMRLPNDGLRLLDIRGLNTANKVVAHCWQVF